MGAKPDDDEPSIEQLFSMLFGMLDPNTPDFHFHRCPKEGCREIWSHDRAKIPGDDGAYETAHTCPKCKVGTCRTKYRDEKDAQARG